MSKSMGDIREFSVEVAAMAFCEDEAGRLFVLLEKYLVAFVERNPKDADDVLLAFDRIDTR